MKNKWTALTTVLLLGFSANTSLAVDTAVEGTVRGYLCATLGKSCPLDPEDPVVAAENLFVVVRPDGSYFLVPNVDRAVLARHMSEKVRVTGALDDKYRALRARTIELYLPSKGGWKAVWSQASEDEARRILYSP